MKKILLLMMLLFSIIIYGKDYSQYKSDKLISSEVAKQLIENNKNVVLIDVRPMWSYFWSSVSGSYQMWRKDFGAKDDRYGEITGMRASKKELEEELNKMGINDNSIVILTGNGVDEFKLWWELDLYGMKNIKIIDGGYEALKNTGIKTSFGWDAFDKKGNYKFPNIPENTTLANFLEVKNAIDNPTYILIDTRSKEEFDGKKQKKGAFAKGRIPSSIHIKWSDVYNEDKTFKSYDEILKIYQNKNVTPDKIIIPYCQSGVMSAHTTFVLKELLGYPQVKNYDGSWIEWSYKVKKGEAILEK